MSIFSIFRRKKGEEILPQEAAPASVAQEAAAESEATEMPSEAPTEPVTACAAQTAAVPTAETTEEVCTEPEAEPVEEVCAESEAESAEEACAEPEAKSAEEPVSETAIVKAEAVLVADEILDSEPEAHLTDMDFSDFWHDIRESEHRYESNKPDTRLIRSVEEALGFKLPDSYIELMRMHNGGMLNRCWYPIRFPAETYSDYIQITHFLGIGRDALYSLCGRFGSDFLLEDKDAFKGKSVAFASCISPSRAILVLDYRNAEEGAEPCVTFVNSQTGEESVVAANFELFIRGLKTSLEALGQKDE